MSNPNDIFFESEWVVYAHHHASKDNYTTAYTKLAGVHSVADFWKCFNNIPSADKLYANKIVLDRNYVSGYSIFKKGILPIWEDKVNAEGCELSCRKMMTIDEFSKYWKELYFKTINMEFSHDVVTGIRVLNKSNRSKKMHKVEVWLSMTDQTVVEDLRKDVTLFKHHEFEVVQHGCV